MTRKYIALLAAALWMGGVLPGSAAVIASFEEAEGFTPNSRTNTAGWSFSNNTRIRISNGTSEPALDGDLSVYTLGGSSTVTAQQLAWAAAEDHLDSYRFSFTSPVTTWVNQATLAWVYIGLWDQTTEAIRYVQLTVRHGATSGAANRMSYTHDNGSGGSTTSQVLIGTLNLASWSTVAADFDYVQGTYGLTVNGNSVLSGIVLPTSWDVTGIVATWLVSPAEGTTTYYDSVAAVPEPSVVSLAFLAGCGWLAFRRRRGHL